MTKLSKGSSINFFDLVRGRGSKTVNFMKSAVIHVQKKIPNKFLRFFQVSAVCEARSFKGSGDSVRPGVPARLHCCHA